MNRANSSAYDPVITTVVVGDPDIFIKYLPTISPQIDQTLISPTRTFSPSYASFSLQNDHYGLSHTKIVINMFQSMIPSRYFYQKDMVAFIVLDICDPDQLKYFNAMVNEIILYSDNNIVIVVARMKKDSDTTLEITLTTTMINELIEKYKGLIVHYYSTSQEDVNKYNKFEEALSIALKHRSKYSPIVIPPQQYKIPLNLIKWNYSNNNNNHNNNNNNNNTNVDNQIFKSIIGNKTIMNHIWRQVVMIHKELGLQVSKSVQHLIENRYFQAALWTLKKNNEHRTLGYNLHQDVSCIPISFFTLLRCSGDLELFQYIYRDIEDSLKPSPFTNSDKSFSCKRWYKSTIMDECIISGSMGIVKFLGSKGYRPSIRGLKLSILFGDVEMVSYLIEKLLKKSTIKSNKSTTLLKQFSSNMWNMNTDNPVIYFQGFEMGFTRVDREHVLYPLKYYTTKEGKLLIDLADMYGRTEIKEYLIQIHSPSFFSTLFQ